MQAAFVVVAVGFAALVWRFRRVTRKQDGPMSDSNSSAEGTSLVKAGTVAYTSQLVTASRALETRRGLDALVVDELAEVLAGDALAEAERYRADRTRNEIARIPIRTKYFDDWLLSVTKDGSIKQIVIPAAGMDTRAYRLAFSRGIQMYEIDQDNVIDEKLRLLSTVKQLPPLKCELTRVKADLSVPDWGDRLVRSGFKPHEPSAWLVEGLLYYLTEDEVKSLFVTIRSLSTKDRTSQLLCSAVTELRSVKDRGTDKKRRFTNFSSLFKWSCPDPEKFFSALDFHVTDVVPIGSEKANYGRWEFSEEGKTIYVSMAVN